MSTIVKALTKEKQLNAQLNLKNFPQDIDTEFKNLFDQSCYKETSLWLSSHKIMSLHDAYVEKFSQKKALKGYDILFNISHTLMYDKKEEIGYIANSQFKIKSSDSLREINNSCILNFLIDEKRQEIAFLVLKGHQKNIVSIQYDEIKLITGQEHLYADEKANKATFK